MHIVLFFRNVFHRHKKSFLFIEITLHYFKKHLGKTMLLYIIVTVSRGIYLDIVQSMKHKFASIAATTCLTLIS